MFDDTPIANMASLTWDRGFSVVTVVMGRFPSVDSLKASSFKELQDYSVFLLLYLFQTFENFTDHCKRLGKGRRVSRMYIHEVPNAFLLCKYRFTQTALSVQQP